jgi:hypothetical protein
MTPDDPVAGAASSVIWQFPRCIRSMLTDLYEQIAEWASTVPDHRLSLFLYIVVLARPVGLVNAA